MADSCDGSIQGKWEEILDNIGRKNEVKQLLKQLLNPGLDRLEAERRERTKQVCEGIRADKFLKEFLQAFSNARQQFSDRDWNERVFPPPGTAGNWTDFMLGWAKGVLHQTSAALGLKPWPHEWLKLDLVLCPPEEARHQQDLPLPMLVAIEHEGDYSGFQDEIAKLFSVRSLLKVGITYSGSLADPSKLSTHRNRLNRIRDHITAVRQTMEECLSCDPKTEYLFLVGVEEKRCCLTWHALKFGACAPEVPDFDRIS